MPTLTRKFSIKKDLEIAEFRIELLKETVNCIVGGDVETGKIALRHYIDGTIGFVPLGEALGMPPKNIMRMLGQKGHLQVRHLFEIVAYLQKLEGVTLEVCIAGKAA